MKETTLVKAENTPGDAKKKKKKNNTHKCGTKLKIKIH